eukprot:symbB.v1.2.037500.t1/scaffold5557.1/size51549/1
MSVTEPPPEMEVEGPRVAPVEMMLVQGAPPTAGESAEEMGSYPGLSSDVSGGNTPPPQPQAPVRSVRVRSSLSEAAPVASIAQAWPEPQKVAGGAAPMGQNKRRRIDGNIDSASRSVAEGLTELEVLSMSGDCILTLNVSDSMLGRDLWKLILDKIPSKPGLQLAVSHTSRLALNESLKQQGLGGERAQVSATYMPVNLLSALRFAHGDSVEDEEFSLNGIIEVVGVSQEMPALLHNLPKSLQALTFAPGFNQGLQEVRLPAGLQRLTLGYRFDQSLDDVTWPAGLQSLTFGENFNQSLDDVTWPAGLQSLTFGENFNQSLDNVTWPAGLQSLTFGRYFNRQSLTFAKDFNQSLDNVTWPAGLQSLTFGAYFNQSLDNVTWPAGLQSLTFGYFFNQSLDKVTFPAGLQTLTFEGTFNQSLDNVTWPAGLQSLTFHSIAGRRLAESLRRGTLVQTYDEMDWEKAYVPSKNGDADAPETHAPETNAVPKAAVAARTLPAKPAAVLAEVTAPLPSEPVANLVGQGGAPPATAAPVAAAPPVPLPVTHHVAAAPLQRYVAAPVQ